MKEMLTRVVSVLLLSAACIGQSAAQSAAYDDSPFGIFNPYTETIIVDKTNISRSEINEYLGDLGVKWVQEMPVPNSTNIESVPQDIKVYSRLVATEGGNVIPNVSEEYKRAARDIVRRYKDRAKIWEVDTEPNAFWGAYPKEYVTFLQTTYQIVKEECSDCKVVLGGLSGFGFWNITEAGDWEKVNSGDPEPPTNDIRNPARFLKAILENGAKGYFDAFEFKQHHARAEDYKLFKNRIEVFGKILSNYGIDIKEMPIYLETAMYDGQPVYPPTHPIANLLPYQTEIQQASALLKTYVYALVQGIDNIFWMYVIERKPDHQVFSHYGLIHDNGSRKLAYYTYKKMVESLEGADWNNIQTIQEAGDVYVYRFTRNGAPVYVAWWDYFNDPTYTPGKTTPVTITGLTGNTALATEAVPRFSAGAEVTDYATAFRQQTLAVTGGTVTLALGENPVFVEGPAVSLRINGNPNVTVTTTNPVTVDYTIRGGAGQEFFLVLDAPAMNILLSYFTAAGQWISLPANLSSVTPYTAAPADGGYTLFSGTAPAGNYVLCLGYDTIPNGRLNLEAAVYDCVEATVR